MKPAAALRSLHRVADMLFPRHCRVCGRRLALGERCLCSACTLSLPYTGYRGRRGNALELLLHGRFSLRRASAFLYYERYAPTRYLILALKYYGRREVGMEMGARMAAELVGTGFFDGVHCVVPVPLSCRRRRSRGYNQSLLLAQGVSRVTGLPVEDGALVRTKNNPTQTSRARSERMLNVQGIFKTVRQEAVNGRHVLLVDDVITTGATVTACADALQAAGATGVSILSLAVSEHIRRI